MTSLPLIESVCEHGGGDLARIATWLLNCLDCAPPPTGGNLSLYLCYHPRDRAHFDSGTINRELAQAMLAIYQQEVQWDGLGCGDLQFDLAETAETSRLSLTLRGDVVSSQQGESDSARPTSIDFYWHAALSQVAPRTLALVRRWMMPMEPENRLTAILTIVEGAKIAGHLDRWQRNIRWWRPDIYLSEGRTALLVGAQAGCDLRASSLKEPVSVTYDSEINEWSWLCPQSPWMPSGCQRNDFIFSCPGRDGKPGVVLHGTRLAIERSWRKQEEENRLNNPKLSLDIVGFFLPLAELDRYGALSDDYLTLPSSVARNAIRLPEGEWLHLDDLSKKSNEWLPLGATFGTKRPRIGCWKGVSGSLSMFFSRELQVDPPYIAPLANGPMSENVPDDLFPKYMDKMLGHAPVRLESEDGLHYRLIFNRTGTAPVFILRSEDMNVDRYDADEVRQVELFPSVEFIVGATHYRLQQVSDGADATHFTQQPEA